VKEGRERLPLSVGILAGGKSSRMGQNKAFLQIGNERIIEKLLKEFEGFPEVLISGAEKGIYEGLDRRVVYDENRDIGPIEGIRRILGEAENEYVFICAADMPFVSKELVSFLSEFISSDYDCYVIADEEHIQPLCAIYKKSALPVIEELIQNGQYRIRELLKRVRTKYIPLDYTCFDKRIVKNINTREDYHAVRKPFVFCVCGYSDSGKTGLIVKLINEFIREGYSAAVIKHDGMDHVADKEGSDTARFYEAGAVCAAVYSDSSVLLHKRGKGDAEKLLSFLRRSDDPPDFIIIEGLKDSGYPKVLVHGAGALPDAIDDGEMSDNPVKLICIAADHISHEQVKCPLYRIDDSRGIFLCIQDYFCL